MKQSVLKLDSFFQKPSKKTVSRHKRIVGVSAFTKKKNGEKRRKVLAKEKEIKQAGYDLEIERWEDFLSSCNSVDQGSRNPVACFQAFGTAPTSEKKFPMNMDLLDEGSEHSSVTTSGCKLSP
jgi:hypothetical protein